MRVMPRGGWGVVAAADVTTGETDPQVQPLAAVALSIRVERESGQLHARVDAELREDVAEMAVHGVRRDEEALGDLPVGQPFGDEPCDGELRRRHRRPTARLGFGGDEAASDAELAQAAADAAGVPAGSQLRVESEGTAEDVDGGVAVGRGEFGAEVFECGG